MHDPEAHGALVHRIGAYIAAGVLARAICDAAGLADAGLASRVYRGTVVAGPATIKRLHVGMDKIAERLAAAKRDGG